MVSVEAYPSKRHARLARHEPNHAETVQGQPLAATPQSAAISGHVGSRYGDLGHIGQDKGIVKLPLGEHSASNVIL